MAGVHEPTDARPIGGFDGLRGFGRPLDFADYMPRAAKLDWLQAPALRFEQCESGVTKRSNTQPAGRRLALATSLRIFATG